MRPSFFVVLSQWEYCASLVKGAAQSLSQCSFYERGVAGVAEHPKPPPLRKRSCGRSRAGGIAPLLLSGQVQLLRLVLKIAVSVALSMES